MSVIEQISKPLTVSELNNQIKSLLENTFIRVLVEGEISNLTYHSSGHIYFSIKDENSSIRCTLFRGNASKIKFKLENGLKIIINGAISVYTPRGEYSINCFNIEPSGIGSLTLAFEQLKKKLEAKGYFNRAIKKKLPRFPKHIIIITSSTGAAIQDMLKVAQKRWPLVKITLIDTIVQGDEAKYSIVKNIKFADSLKADVIIVGRGGGTIEDLWAFNEEIVADAIFEAKTPIVSAVGHEVDVVISDFVADIRAPTPSAAMEMILPDISEMLMLIDNLIEELNRSFLKIIQKKELLLNNLFEHFKRNSFEQKIVHYQKEIGFVKSQFDKSFEYILNQYSMKLNMIKKELNINFDRKLQQKFLELNSLISLYNSNNPKNRAKIGYAQVIKDKKIVSLKEVKIDDEIELQDASFAIKSKVLDKIQIDEIRKEKG